MFNTNLVLVTADYDCDGVSRGAHRIAVPAHRAAEFCADPGELLSFAQRSGALSSYYDVAERAMPAREFVAQYRDEFRSAEEISEFFGGGADPFPYVSIRSETYLRDCTAPYETTADLNEAWHIERIEADIAMAGDTW